MRILYHFAQSPYSRRARLALAHKALEVELRDAREEPAHLVAVRRLNPLHTVPVLLEEGGVALGDSSAIAHYLDRAYPDRPLWPTDREGARQSCAVAALVDGALAAMTELGGRYAPLATHEAWGAVRAEMLDRAQSAWDALGGLVNTLGRPTVGPQGFAGADMWLYTAVAWLEGLPARAPTHPPAARITALGCALPPVLSDWAARHRDMPAIQALG